MMEWCKTDPRESIGKRGNIVIVSFRDAYMGRVETKETWCIWTTHPSDRLAFISADDEWPDHWQWTLAPSDEPTKTKGAHHG